jgi:hypothetical protein
MRYRCYDIGHRTKGTSVVVRLRGSTANVILVDPQNLTRYRCGQPFLYEGGHYWRSPAQIPVPRDGHWFVVIDHGGYKGRVRAEIEVIPDDLNEVPNCETTPVEAVA